MQIVIVHYCGFETRPIATNAKAIERRPSPLTREHVTDTLATLHWLRLPQRVDFKVAVMTFRVLHGLAPLYLNQLARVADLPSRCRLRSASSHQLFVTTFQLTTVGRRTFPVAASLLWNALPSDIQESTSLFAFRQRLKTRGGTGSEFRRVPGRYYPAGSG